MLPLTYNTQDVFVVNDAWDGNNSFDCDFSVVRDLQIGLTKHEARRPYSATLRVKAVYSATVRGEALTQLLSSLRALNEQPVVIPFWPAVDVWANRAALAVDGGLKIVWKSDWSQFAIYTEADGEPGWPADGDFVAPALWGFLNPTQPELLEADSAIWEIDFEESSPTTYALIPPASDAIAGPTPAGYVTAPKLLPFNPDFSQVKEVTNVDVIRDEAGFTREKNPTFYPQNPAKKQAANYALFNDDWAQFLSFFQSYAATGASFWAPGWYRVAKLVDDVLATDTVLNVADSGAVAAGDTLMFYSGGNSIFKQVLSVGAGVITLTAVIGTALPADGCEIYPLLLVRLDKPMIKVSWSDLNAAHSTIQWTELGAEYTIPIGETFGVTTGKLNQRVILFQFIRDYLNGTVVNNYYTNFEADIVQGATTWLHQNFDHGDIPQSLNLENDIVEVTSFKFAGNPVIADLVLNSTGILALTIFWADYDGVNVTNVQQVFSGQLSKPGRKGNKFSTKFGAGPVAALDGMVPKLVRGTMCNHLKGANPGGTYLLSYGCTLLKAAWSHTATVAGITSIYPYVLSLTGLTHTAGGAALNYFANWFALGWIEVGAGINLQRRFIVASSNPVAGALTLTLGKWFDVPPNIGDEVTFYPGCDGIYTTCQAYQAVTNPTGKFNNYLNFGGEPFLPPGNPTLSAMIPNPAAGSKK